MERTKSDIWFERRKKEGEKTRLSRERIVDRRSIVNLCVFLCNKILRLDLTFEGCLTLRDVFRVKVTGGKRGNELRLL